MDATLKRQDASQPSSPRPSLERIQVLAADDMDQVNALIVERMHSPVTLIPQLATHIVAAGGKRLRPLLALVAAKLCGYEGRNHILVATCVEFIHTATLLHDDVVDESDLRRGQASANAVWGNQPSVLVGDFLFSRSFVLMVETGMLEVLDTLSKASAVIAEGEVHQLLTTNDLATDEATYLDVIHGKTAQLFAAATRLGATVAGRPEADKEALERFGMNLGTAFQLVDDVLDYSARQAELGKTIGDDFREGKVTLPVIFAFQAGDETEQAFWRRTIEKLEQTDADLAEAQRLLQRHGALDATMKRAREEADAAIAELTRFSDGPAKEALTEAVLFCVDRVY